MGNKLIFLVSFFSFLLILPSFSGSFDLWKICDESNVGRSVSFGGNTYYCCRSGNNYYWSTNKCECSLQSFSISPSSVGKDKCGTTISVTASVTYQASGCSSQYQSIIIKRPDGSELCRISISTTSSSGSCSGSYSVPETDGSYTFGASFKNQYLSASLGVDCEENETKPQECGGALGTFSSRCPTEQIGINLNCGNGEVCIYRIENVFVCDNTLKVSNTISSGYYCIDKKNPYFVDISHIPELTSSADNTYDPFPNFYYDMQGSSKSLTPDKVVIDKEYVTFISKSRDEYKGREISGVKSSSLYFSKSNEPKKSTNFPVNSCPGGGSYAPPATHKASFGSLDIGWGTLSADITDQVGNSASNSNYRIYIFLGARGDHQNQGGTDKMVFLKTYWDSSEEVKNKTSSLGGNSFKKINCFGYTNKCTQIRDIIGKTNEFTDCLWVGPFPKNVSIYNFKEIVDLDNNIKINPPYFKDYGNRIVIAWEDIKINELRKIAICSKNDTGILVDLPFLVSKNIKDGFQILPSTERRFSIIWEAEYAREQRELNLECYLNPTKMENNEIKVCTLNDILYGNCHLESGQKCICGNIFPCTQNTERETINSCSVEYPRYFSGINRIICKMYDPRDKGLRIEVWFNHEFLFIDGKIFDKKSSLFEFFYVFLAEKIINSFNFLKW